MRLLLLVVAIAAIAAVASLKSQQAQRAGDDPSKARINVEHLARFWRAYEEAQKVDAKERAAVYDKLYMSDADAPLAYFLKRAKMTPEKMARMTDMYRSYFASLYRHRDTFSAQADALRAAFIKFKKLYPEAKFPDTYVMIGGFSTGGTTSNDGLLMGGELFGRHPDTPMHELGGWQKRVLMSPEDFVPLAVHECVHFQQPGTLRLTLLSQCLQEGAADFVSFIVTGKVIKRIADLHAWANPRERELWLAFQKEMGGTKTAGWLYGDPRDGWPDDVGYWMGFKICESYYERAEDKEKALKTILTYTSSKAFLEVSKYGEKFR